MRSEEIEVEKFEDGEYRVRVLVDMDPSSPREDDNVSVIVGMHSRYNIGDRKPDPDELAALERGGVPLLKRFLRMSRGMIAFTMIGMYDHSGITIYPMDEPGAFRGVDTAWDHSTVGFAYITREQFDVASGGDPNEEIPVSDELVQFVTDMRVRKHLGETVATTPRVWQNLYGELKDYDDFVRGEVYGYVVEKSETWRKDSDPDEERQDWEEVESCWGFIGESEYALSEGKSVLEYLKKDKEAVPA
jgi:hypothetical protein